MFGWNKRREHLRQEFEQHIEFDVEENIAAGMSPEEARRAARKKFGNVLLASESSQDVWGGLWLESVLVDVRYAVRRLIVSPAYAATLVSTLALGLGAVSTMLAVSQSVLHQPLRLPHPEQLFELFTTNGPSGTHASQRALSYNVIGALEHKVNSFSYLGAYNTLVRPVTAADGTRVTLLTVVTPQFFPMFGIQPRLGRFIRPGDSGAPVVVVSDEFWRERLHAQSNAIGSAIKVSGQVRTVIGVMPPEFHAPQGTGAPVVYLPVQLDASGNDQLMMQSANVLVRLKPSVSEQRALASARMVFAHVDQSSREQSSELVMRSYQAILVGDLRAPLLALLGGVGVLLLISCANAANLQIGRAAGRLAEMRTRAALGASFRRLVQQMITESVLVSSIGGALGAVVSFAAVAAMKHFYGQQFPRFDELSVRPVVLAWTALLAVGIGVAASLAPMSRVRRQTRVGDGSRSVTRTSRVPGLLVSAQVALTCVLLVISGLFVRTLQALQDVRLGFDPTGITTMVLMPEQQNQDPEVSRAIETRLLKRFEALPGVESVTMQTEVPFSNYNMTLNGTTDVSGRAFRLGDTAFYSMVSTNFVRTSGIRPLAGRGLQPSDVAGSGIVVLVNEAFAKKYLGRRDPIGTTIRFHRNPTDTDADMPFLQPMRIVGVVENEIQGGNLGAPYEPMVYLDYLQLPKGSMLGMIFSMSAQYAVRSKLPSSVLAAELRTAVKSEAPSMVEMSLKPMESSVVDSLRERRMALRLVTWFGLIALVLTAIGIYGVLAYSVALRRREIGIRMALGSTRGRTAAIVISQAGWMAMMGLLPGLLGAWAGARAVHSFLFGVSTFDPVATAIAGLALAIVFAAAASVPVARAAQVDPAETLRAE